MAEHHGVAGAHDGPRDLLAVEERAALAEAFDLEGVARGADRELTAREGGAVEQRPARADPPRAPRPRRWRTKCANFSTLALAPADEELLARGKERDLAGAVRLLRERTTR